MKIYITELFQSLKQFSRKLDDIALLTNQHWVVLSELENSKIVYIFLANSDLLISCDGNVEKAKWQYLGNNTLLIDRRNESLLFKHGFFDENILALKIDGKTEYTFLINESKYDDELNSLEKIKDFLVKKYLKKNIIYKHQESNQIELKPILTSVKQKQIYKTRNGIFEVEQCIELTGQKITKDGFPAPDGKFNLGYLTFVHIKNGVIVKETLF